MLFMQYHRNDNLLKQVINMRKIYFSLIILFFQLHVLPTFADNGSVSLRVISGENGIARLETSDNIELQVVNESSVPISSVDYVIVTNRKASEEIHLDFSPELTTYNSQFALSVAVPADEETGSLTKKIRITKVNSQANLSENNEVEIQFFTVTNIAPRRVVMEEYTGIWCGYCPKGEAAMNRLDSEYAGSVVTISVHSGDVISNSDYSSAALIPSGLPKASLSRALTDVDPYRGTTTGFGDVCPIRNDVDQLLRKGVEVTVECSPQWTDDSHTAINPNASAIFHFDNRNSRYAFGYVLLEDGMSGPGKDWAQVNYYTGNTYASQFGGDEYMKEFLEGDDLIYGKEYDRVAIVAYGIQRGVPSSIGSPIVADEVRTHDYQIAATDSRIQDKNNLRVAVLLFNINSGEIVNAAVARVGESSMTSIGDTPTVQQTTPVAYYSLDGRKLNEPQRGLNIVRLNDGTVKKVLVK